MSPARPIDADLPIIRLSNSDTAKPMTPPCHFRLHDSRTAAFLADRSELVLYNGDKELKRVSLGYAEGRLLDLLVSQPGTIRTREDITAHAWPDRVVSAGSINQAIFTIRNAIGDGDKHEIIETIPRRGYRFNASHLIADRAATDSSAADDASAAESMPDSVVTNSVVTGGDGTKPGKGEESIPEIAPPLAPHLSPKPRIAVLAAIYVALAVFVAWALLTGGWSRGAFDRVVHVQTQQANGVTWHFVDHDQTASAQLQSDLAEAIKAMPADARGIVWVNRRYQMVDFSCIRSDRSTQELEVSQRQASPENLAKWVSSCLRAGS